MLKNALHYIKINVLNQINYVIILKKFILANMCRDKKKDSFKIQKNTFIIR